MAVFKRKVFYLGGFDPRGARYYHALLARQVAAHNGAGGRPEGVLALSDRRRAGGNAGWTLADEAGRMQGDHEFLVWDDLVRAHWVKSPMAVLARGAAAYGHMLRWFDWRLARRCPRGSWYAALLPGLALGLAPVIVGVLVWLGLRVWLGGWAALAVAGVAGGLGGIWLLRRLPGLWLLRFVIFNDALARRRHRPELDARLDAFAARIHAALGEDWDEVLLITHSNGSILAVPLMDRLRAMALRGGLPGHFALVTLGSCIPFVGLRRDAGWFGAMLDRMGGFGWLDIGSPTDGACAPLVAPCLGRAVERPEGLVQISPRWFRYCNRAAYDARRRDKYQIHFDYLRRMDRASPLDYLGLVASARPLAQSIAAFEAEQHG